MRSNRFEELEKKCKRLRYKTFIKYTLFLIFFVSLMLLILFTIQTKKSKHIPAKHQILKQHKIIKNQTKKSKKLIELNLELNMSKIDITKKSKHIPAKHKIAKKQSKKLKKDSNISVIVKKIPKKSNFIIHFTPVSQEIVLLKNYNSVQNYNNAIKLAIYYFNLKEYEKAIYYAKIASKLKADKSISWIIYAKSKYKLNQRQDAIGALETYLNYFYSKDADMLLQKYKVDK